MMYVNEWTTTNEKIKTRQENENNWRSMKQTTQRWLIVYHYVALMKMHPADQYKSIQNGVRVQFSPVQSSPVCEQILFMLMLIKKYYLSDGFVRGGGTRTLTTVKRCSVVVVSSTSST